MADTYHFGNELNNFSTTLVNAVGSGDGSMELTNIGGLVKPSNGDRLLLTIVRASDPSVVEIVNVTDVTGSVVTMTRAQEGTTALGWNAGDLVQARPTAGLLSAFKEGLAEINAQLSSQSALSLTRMFSLAGGSAHNAAVHTDGTVTASGDDSYGQTTGANAFEDVIQIAAGEFHYAALHSDGTVSAAGWDSDGQVTGVSSLTGVVMVKCGQYHTVALHQDGTVTAIGSDSWGQVAGAAVLTNVVGIACGFNFTWALHADGTVTAFGQDSSSVVSGVVALTDVVQIEAGFQHGLALHSDGTVTAYGLDNNGQVAGAAALTDVVQVAGGYWHSLALHSDGSVTAFGNDAYGQVAGGAALADVVQVAAGVIHTLALHSDGSVTAFGDNGQGEITAANSYTDVATVRSEPTIEENNTNSGDDTDTVLDWGAAAFFIRDMTAPATFTFSNLPAFSGERTLIISGADSNAPDLPVSYVGGGAPTWTERDIVRLFKLDGDETVWLQYLGTMPFPVVPATYDVIGTTVAYTSNSFNLTTELTSNVDSIYMSPDGSKLYVGWHVSSTSASVEQYSLTTPGTLAGGVSHDGTLDIFSVTPIPTGLLLSPDGTKLYVTNSGARTVYQWSLTVAHSVIGGASLDGSRLLATASNGNVGDAICFGQDGSKLISVSNASNGLHQWSLGVAYDVTGSFTEDGEYWVNGETTQPGHVAMSPSGDKVILQDVQYGDLYQYSLTVPGDVTGGVTHDGMWYDESAPFSGNACLCFKQDGSGFLIGATGDPDSVFEYSIT